MSNKAIKEIDKHNDELSIQASADRMNRARSVTVGTAFNGVTEVVLRGDGKYLFAILQPTEVVELIHQLAANVGCHLQLAPRRDFASWRQWKTTEEELAFYRGIGSAPNLNGAFMQERIEGDENGEPLAIEAPKQRRRAKRAAAAS